MSEHRERANAYLAVEAAESLQAQLQAAREERDRAYKTINEIEDELTDHGEAIQSPLVDAVCSILSRLSDAEASLAALRAVAIEAGACRCLWDVNPDEGGPDDVIVKPNPECPVHTASESRSSQGGNCERCGELHPPNADCQPTEKFRSSQGEQNLPTPLPPGIRVTPTGESSRPSIEPAPGDLTQQEGTRE